MRLFGIVFGPRISCARRTGDHPIVRDLVDMITVGRFMQQLCHGTSVRSAKFGVRFEREPRPQHEGPLPCSRMRQRQVGIVAFLTVEVDDVQIERTGSPVIGALPSMRGFDALQSVQQFGRGKSGVHGYDRIAEFRRSFRHAPRVGAIQRRYPRHLCGRQSVHTAHRVAQRRRHITLVASHGDDDMMRPAAFPRIIR